MKGELHVLALQHADATSSPRRSNEIHRPAPPRPERPAVGRGQGADPIPRAMFEGRIESERRQGDELDRRDVVERDYAAAPGVMDKLDQARRQVFIEAVIMDLS